MKQPLIAERMDDGPASHIREILEGRRKIDAIDLEVIRLLRERKNISTAVQQRRVEMGHPRLQTAREIEIVKRYGTVLGKSGNKVAMAILEACRGSAALNPTTTGDL